MIFAAINHEIDYPYIFPQGKNKLKVRLKCNKGDLKKCYLVYFDKYRNWKRKIEMEIYASGRYHDMYQGIIQYDPFIKYINYYFELLGTQREKYCFSDNGFSMEKPEKGFFEFSYLHQNDIYSSPDWLEDSIFYQIFVDRFFDGDKDNNPINTINWGSLPNTTDHMGGDLKGIIKKIDYIKNLGVNTLYLTPIFKAHSYHKYDTLDYYQIDSAFGSIEDLTYLVEKCHNYDIKVILDGVFNHVGYYYEPFQDAIKKGEKSVYYDWFYFYADNSLDTKVKYKTTGYYDLMPKLNLLNPELKKYILDVVRFWMEKSNIDGWRLDVADEMDKDFLRDLRKLIKSINKQAFIIGEIWYDGRKMLKGDQVDSVMNYIFRQHVRDFFAKDKIAVKQFVENIEEMRIKYPEIIEKNLLNLLDSHDTERFLSSCNNNLQKFKLSVGFQLTFTGIPMIFYGDEIGLKGKNDPDCRQGMIWGEDKKQGNVELFDWYRKMIKIRKNNKELKCGNFSIVHINQKQNGFIFERSLGSEKIFVVINNSANKWELKYNINIKGSLIDLLSGKKVIEKSKDLKANIDGYNLLILKEVRGEEND